MGWAISVITISLVMIIILVIRRHAARNMTSQLILASQTPTNQAMRYAQADLPQIFGDVNPISSTLIANVWGHGVMTFEFCFANLTVANQAETINKLEVSLNRYAQSKNLRGYQGTRTPFKVTDFWQSIDGKEIWHIDVTYIVNEVTLEYTHDLEKLNNRG